MLSCSKNPVDARDKNIQQRAESLSLAGAYTYTLPFISKIFETKFLEEIEEISYFTM